MASPSTLTPAHSAEVTPSEPAKRAGVDSVAAGLLIVGGIAGIAQMLLPWFPGSSGWDLYYNSSLSSISVTIAAYAILASLIAGVLMVLVGAASLFAPARQRTFSKLVRYPAAVAIVAALWWVLGGPKDIGDAFTSGSIGWYLFLLAGVLGLVGALKPITSPNLTFDKASFMAVFLGLPLLIFIVFVLSPFIQAIYYSMTDWKGFSPDMNFIGFDNYVKLFSDEKFHKAMLNSIELGIVVPLVTIILALAIASMVTVGGPTRGPVRGIRASSLYRVVSFFPYTIPAIVIGLLWAAVYQPKSGLLDGFLALVGLSGPQSGWLGSPSTAMAVSMFVIIWSFVGFYTVLFVASIKGISSEVYEAAKLDGAGRFRTAISVTVPLIRDSIQTAYIYLGIASLDAFVYMMALNSNGGPDYSTLVMSQDLYLTAFAGNSQWGLATAMGVVLAIVTLLFATVVFVVNHLTSGRKVAYTR